MPFSYLYYTTLDLFQDGGEDNIATNNEAFSAKNAQNDWGASYIRADIPNTNLTVNAAMMTNPLYFVRSGGIDIDGLIYGPGISGYQRTGTAAPTYANDTGKAFRFTFGAIEVAPSYISYRFHGNPLRCLHQS